VTLQGNNRDVRLIVLADDWGRHPSSAQHLIGQLLPRYETLWVNTIGSRRPTLTLADARRAIGRLLPTGRRASTFPDASDPAKRSLSPRVIAPLMYPGYRNNTQRRINAALVSRAIHKALGPRDGRARVVVTTLPQAADLPARLDVDGWLYCCVDDFSLWPGLDGRVMRELEMLLLPSMNRVIAVSQELQKHLKSMGAEGGAQAGAQVELLTHGIDPQHWREPFRSVAPGWTASLRRPVVLFWGLIDERLDVSWCGSLLGDERFTGTLVLVGPSQSPPPALGLLKGSGRLLMPGQVPYESLPAVAAQADVLVMPYADLPVTRAMQPLKLKEYLATGKPVVVRELPSTQAWTKACDVVSQPQEFVQRVLERIKTGTPAGQRQAREALSSETWQGKAQAFEHVIRGCLQGA
jgi:glycosyltransferase involved in cell wall biosynthesis